MCGLAGWVASKGVDIAVLRRMTAALTHRGPDAEGFYVSPDHRVGLGFRRLSIIDLATGDQPLSNEDDTIWVIFNGELYNFPDLRADLERRGHRFKTRSDTEVVVHAYEQYGEDCVRYFNGMFAFALFDEREGHVFLARDRFGEKPLHYAIENGDFLFASEIKGLLAHPRVGKRLDLRALARYLTYEYVPSPSSIFQEIKKLPPAHWMTYDVQSGEIRLSRYWDLKFQPDATLSPQEAADELRGRLRQAVKMRLQSDVPLGVLLSGGIDSSSVVALMAELVPPRQIKSFTVAFTDRSFDESRFAQDVARKFGTEHHERVFDARAMLTVLPEVLSFLDEPLADASLLPTYLLSRFTRQSVTVALGGDGGDELLAGYPTFVASRYARSYERLPRFIQHLVQRVAARLPASTKNFSFDFKLRQFLKGIQYPEPRRTQVWLGSFSPSDLCWLLSEEIKAELNGFDVLEDLDVLLSAPAVSDADWLNRLVYQHVNTYLADDILAKVDRASMACSLEVRAPFLDHSFAEFLGTLPSSFKLRGRESKYLLRKSLAGLLPDNILHRPKKGFGIPIARWLKDEMSALAREALGTEKLRKQGLFNPKRVAAMLDEHQAGVRNNRKPLWTLLVFQLWSERLGL